MERFTHTGRLFGCDSRTNPGWSQTVKLRETKNFWITHFKVKYSKDDGRATGSFPLLRLDLNSIREIGE